MLALLPSTVVCEVLYVSSYGELSFRVLSLALFMWGMSAIPSICIAIQVLGHRPVPKIDLRQYLLILLAYATANSFLGILVLEAKMLRLLLIWGGLSVGVLSLLPSMQIVLLLKRKKSE